MAWLSRNKLLAVLVLFVLILVGQLIYIRFREASLASLPLSITTQSEVPNVALSIKDKSLLLTKLSSIGIKKNNPLYVWGTIDKKVPVSKITILLTDKPQKYARFLSSNKDVYQSVGQEVDGNEFTLKVQYSAEVIKRKTFVKRINNDLAKYFFILTDPNSVNNIAEPDSFEKRPEFKNFLGDYFEVSMHPSRINNFFYRFLSLIPVDVVEARCDGTYFCGNTSSTCTCSAGSAGNADCSSSGALCVAGSNIGTCSCTTTCSDEVEKYCYNVGAGQCNGYKQCSQMDCSTGAACSWVDDPLPTTLPGTPTPTPPPAGGSCIGLGGSCLGNPNGCCAGTGCQTTPGLPGYGTCFDDNSTGGCSYEACSGAACTSHYYNPDPARGGCYKPDDDRCNVTNGCLTPVPTLAIGTCSISAPSQVNVGTVYDVVLSKNQSGGALYCNEPSVNPNVDCEEYAYGPFDDCQATSGCSGGVRAKGSGTCTLSSTCTNIQNGAQVSCSAQVQQISSPTATPTPWIRVNVEKADGTTRNVSEICRINCSSSTCNIQNVCSQDTNTFTFSKPGITNTRGGRIELTAPNGQPLVILGVTPSQNGTYLSDCLGQGGACYGWQGGTWTTGGRTVTFVVGTPTPTLTPTVAPWRKIANSSFQSDDNLTQDFPTTVVAYDGDDTADRLFSVKKSGIATIPNSSLSASELNGSGWYNQSDPSVVLNKNSFLSYAKARKKITTLTTLSGDLSQITADGIYYYNTNGTPFNITTNYSTQTYDFVLIIDGTVNFDIGTERFNVDTSIATKPARRAVAILADTINFYNGTNYMDNANGIFVATTMNTGSLVNAPLKIKGNIITSSFVNGRTNGNNQSPSVFVVFDGKQYVDLLPLLSVSKYDWKQLQ